MTLRRAYLVAKQRVQNGVNEFDAAESAGKLYGLGYREITQIWVMLLGG
jgi:hypothetical protein